MPQFEVQVVLRRTYGTVTVEAETPELAVEEAISLDEDRFDTAEDRERDLVYVDEAHESLRIDTAGTLHDGQVTYPNQGFAEGVSAAWNANQPQPSPITEASVSIDLFDADTTSQQAVELLVNLIREPGPITVIITREDGTQESHDVESQAEPRIKITETPGETRGLYTCRACGNLYVSAEALDVHACSVPVSPAKNPAANTGEELMVPYNDIRESLSLILGAELAELASDRHDLRERILTSLDDYVVNHHGDL